MYEGLEDYVDREKYEQGVLWVWRSREGGRWVDTN